MFVQHSEEPGGSGDRSAMEDKGEKKRKKHGPAVWQSFKKVGGEVGEFSETFIL